MCMPRLGFGIKESRNERENGNLFEEMLNIEKIVVLSGIFQNIRV